MAKKRKKQTARKQKKQNLAGMDFDELMNLRGQGYGSGRSSIRSGKAISCARRFCKVVWWGGFARASRQFEGSEDCCEI
jgi:hypothetical protein